MRAIALGGTALHAGVPSSVVLVRRPGGIAIRRHHHEVPLTKLAVARTDRGVAVESDCLRVDLVEHLLAAVGGMRVTADLRIDVFGPEIPLLDGGARRFAAAFRQLGVPASPPERRIERTACFEVGRSRYRFEPGGGVEVSVRVDFDHPLIAEQAASWKGSREDFEARIAPARTFGFRRDADALRRAGRAGSVDLAAVVVLDDDGTSPSGPPPGPDECARHKLLDLLGDLVLSGGVPCGRLHAYRPGHEATRRCMQWASGQGVVVGV